MTSGPEPMDLARLYQERFSDRDLAFKRRSWEVLCRKVMQAYVRPTDTVLDLGAGSCEFINAISAGTKIAVDLNPDVATFAESARVVLAPCTDVGEVETGTVDVVFCSNLLEHLPDKATVLQTLNECHRMLKPGGTLMILRSPWRRSSPSASFPGSFRTRSRARASLGARGCSRCTCACRSCGRCSAARCSWWRAASPGRRAASPRRGIRNRTEPSASRCRSRSAACSRSSR
jgi:SAM-dependent methyltransferase